VEEAEAAVQDTSGQHASITSKTEDRLLQWVDIGAMLILTVKIALQTYQLLAFYSMCKIVEPKPRWQNGICVVQTYHPPDLVSVDTFWSDVY